MSCPSLWGGSISSLGASPSTPRFGKTTNVKGKLDPGRPLSNLTDLSVAGFSLEFATLNPCGFYFYSFYSIAGFIDPGLGAGTVEVNDLFFAIHAFALSSAQLSQIFVYEV